MTDGASGAASSPEGSSPPRRGRGRTLGVVVAVAVVAGAIVAAIVLRRPLELGWLAHRARGGSFAAWQRLAQLDPTAALDVIGLDVEVVPARERAGSPSHDTLAVRIVSRRMSDASLPVGSFELRLAPEAAVYRSEWIDAAGGIPLHVDYCGEMAPHQPPRGSIVVPAGGAAAFDLSVGVFCGLVEHSKCGPLLDPATGSMNGFGQVKAGTFEAVLTLGVSSAPLFDLDDGASTLPIAGIPRVAPVVALASAPFVIELR